MSDKRMVAKLNKIDKAAVLLLSLGETDAAQVLQHMGPKKCSGLARQWHKCAISIASKLSR